MSKEKETDLPEEKKQAIMTKQEAVHAMVAGKKVTHRYFSRNEWATMVKGRITFEDGVSCSLIEFWNDRTDSAWETDWELFEPAKN